MGWVLLFVYLSGGSAFGEPTVTFLGGGNGFLDGSLSEARFGEPQGMVFASSSRLWVADSFNHCVREIDLNTEQVTTATGICEESGKDEQLLYFPTDLAVCPDGRLVIADTGNERVVLWSPDHPEEGFSEFRVMDADLGGWIALKKPVAVDCVLDDDRVTVLILDAALNRIFQADAETGTWIRQANRSGGSGYSLFETDAEAALLNTPTDLLALDFGNQQVVFFTDSRNEMLRTLRLGESSGWIVGNYVGNEDRSFSVETPPDPLISLNRPYRLAYSNRDSMILVGLPLENQVLAVGLDRTVSEVFLKDEQTESVVQRPSALAVDRSGNLYGFDASSRLWRIDRETMQEKR